MKFVLAGLLVSCLVSWVALTASAAAATEIFRMSCALGDGSEGKGVEFSLEEIKDMQADWDSRTDRACAAASIRYRLIAGTGGYRPSAICGVWPTTYIDLYRNGRKIIDQVVFGENCWQQPAITHVQITGGSADPSATYAKVCYMTDGRVPPDILGRPGCHSLTRAEWEAIVPITYKSLERLVQEWAKVDGV